MPRYLVERTFAENITLPSPGHLEQARHSFVANNARFGVVWVHSYIVPKQRKSYCIYDAPSPEALRRAAQQNGLPVDRITEVRLLDPYFYSPDTLGALE